jgi:hypothetical protein
MGETKSPAGKRAVSLVRRENGEQARNLVQGGSSGDARTKLS